MSFKPSLITDIALSHVDGISIRLLPDLVDQRSKLGIQFLNLSVEAITSRLNLPVTLHLLQHVSKIILNFVCKLLHTALLLEATNLFHLLQYLLNAITEVNTNLPRRRLHRIKRRIKPLLATAHTVLARLDGFTDWGSVFCLRLQIRVSISQDPQERRNEHQHSVPQTLYWKVGYGDPTCTDFPILPTIPNELRQPLGQLGNRIISTTIQSFLNILNLWTKLGIRLCNIPKKILNFTGEGFDGFLTTTILPILPRHPEDPVDGLLQVGGSHKRGENNVTMSRQEGAHKGAKAAEVEAVGATAQGVEARVAGEGWAGRAGGVEVSVRS
ncbi:reticulon-like protein B8 [Babesia caballi]|uniref:Reticulon-like protein B8 n=1 Tax=Babesia caballi TaxID=5871 RepID=A0AAV4LRH7_BABCB|nr:reticulon-like protein B8 [Babesia caballi]